LGCPSHWETRLHFGFGQHARVDALDVRWTGGGTDHWGQFPAARRLKRIAGSRVDQGRSAAVCW
jgi:hypothetical protein